MLLRQKDKIGTQNETLDSDIEERCKGGGGRSSQLLIYFFGDLWSKKICKTKMIV